MSNEFKRVIFSNTENVKFTVSALYNLNNRR